MNKTRMLEISVGAFMLIGFLAFAMLGLKVSGLTNTFGKTGYLVTAQFDNIGDLKARAPITVAGVRIGQVAAIELNPKTYQANVILEIYSNHQDIPIDSSAQILTQGLLGSNYISIDPGFSNTFLKEGGQITRTHPALILENLIGQLLFKVSGDDDKKPATKQAS